MDALETSHRLRAAVNEAIAGSEGGSVILTLSDTDASHLVLLIAVAEKRIADGEDWNKDFDEKMKPEILAYLREVLGPVPGVA